MTRIPIAAPRRASARPIDPRPTIPRVRPASETPCGLAHAPPRTEWSMRCSWRASMTRYPRATSATSSPKVSGVLVTRIPSSAAAHRSMLSRPIPHFDTTRSRAALWSTSAFSGSSPAIMPSYAGSSAISSAGDSCCTTSGRPTLMPSASKRLRQSATEASIGGQVTSTASSAMLRPRCIECGRHLEVDLLVDVPGLVRGDLEQERTGADARAPLLEKIAREQVEARILLEDRRQGLRAQQDGRIVVEGHAVGRPEPRLEPSDAEQRVVAVAPFEEGADRQRDGRWAEQRVRAVRLQVQVGGDAANVVEEHVVHRHRAAAEVFGTLQHGDCRERACSIGLDHRAVGVDHDLADLRGAEQRLDDVVVQGTPAQRPVVLAWNALAVVAHGDQGGNSRRHFGSSGSMRITRAVAASALAWRSGRQTS